jgi:hypothetical protein
MLFPEVVSGGGLRSITALLRRSASRWISENCFLRKNIKNETRMCGVKLAIIGWNLLELSSVRAILEYLSIFRAQEGDMKAQDAQYAPLTQHRLSTYKRIRTLSIF